MCSWESLSLDTQVASPLLVQLELRKKLGDSLKSRMLREYASFVGIVLDSWMLLLNM